MDLLISIIIMLTPLESKSSILRTVYHSNHYIPQIMITQFNPTNQRYVDLQACR